MKTGHSLRISILIVATLLSAASCRGQRQYSPEEESLRKEIAKMLIVGFRGTELTPDNHIVRDIRDLGVGGVILFEYDVPSKSRPRNITSAQQLGKLCSSLQELSDNRLLIAIDQEGGMVSRLKVSYGFPYFASAQKTATDGTDSVRHYARLTATTLANTGINVDFAPCVDVNVNPNCPIIGKLGRSFGSDPDKVTQCARIWIEELQGNGVVGCMKHFPGHGSSSKDTHLGIADVSDTWQPLELEPYRTLIAEGNVKMIMTTHVFNAALDSRFPATLSHATLTTLLRDSLHYDGVIVTDDLAMKAMTQQYSYEEMLRYAILAGADMLCLSNNGEAYDSDIVPRTIDIIYNMVVDGEIPASRIHQSVARINKLIK